MSTAPLSIKIDTTYKERLNRLALDRQRSSHALAREAIERFIEEEEFKAQALRDAVASHAEYLETGLHLTLEEVDGWLATWGTDNEQEAPPCHT